mmetsp:Transcript_21279/g.66682  ORF Transcript_21279/g.66682 Transcript_21279/m.66682 type:complete len:262 (+) Transcript_21279:2-787(+)
MIAQAHLLSHSTSSGDPASSTAVQRARRAAEAAQHAVKLAREVEEPPLLAYALCELAQACSTAKRTREAMQAAGEAGAVYRAIGDRQGEAYSLVAGAKACVADGRLQRAWEVAGEALLIFRELGDDEGCELAEAAIDAAESPNKLSERWLLDVPQQAMLAAQAASRPGAAAAPRPQGAGLSGQELVQLRGKIRDTVVDIAGIEDIVDDSPLMNMGLTSQSGVLLRNSLAKQFPGPSLPFTMMFDFPSINSLTDYFSGRGIS